MNAEEQFRVTRRSLVKPSEALSAQGELSLDVRSLLALMERMAERVKVLENKVHKLQNQGQDE